MSDFIKNMDKVEVIKSYLSDESVKLLLDVANKKSDKFNLNVNDLKVNPSDPKVSKFTTYRFYEFDKETKEVVKENMHPQMKHKANELYFLSVKGNGELHPFQAPKESTFVVFSVALNKCNVRVDGKTYNLNAGDAIYFPLFKEHSVPPNGRDQMFFNHLLIGAYES